MSGFALQQAIYAALAADSAIDAQIYDVPPRDVALPYIVLGEGSVSDYGTSTESGSEHLLTLHIWSRTGGMKQARLLAEAVRTALDGAALTVSGCTLVGLSFQTAAFARDSEGETLHATLRFRAVTEP